MHVKNVVKNLPARAKEFQKVRRRDTHALSKPCITVSIDIKLTYSKSNNKQVSWTCSYRNEIREIRIMCRTTISVLGRRSLYNVIKLELQPPDEARIQPIQCHYHTFRSEMLRERLRSSAGSSNPPFALSSSRVYPHNSETVSAISSLTLQIAPHCLRYAERTMRRRLARVNRPRRDSLYGLRRVVRGRAYSHD